MYKNNKEFFYKTELSPYDSSYPATLLSNILDYQLSLANNNIEHIYAEVAKKTNINNSDNKEEKTNFVVDINDDTMDKLKNRTLKLSKENGNIYAQLRKNGKYSKKLPIKEEILNKEISKLELEHTMELSAIQDALICISSQLRDINECVKDIISGQQNDRIGLYYSGLSLYLESSNIEDEKLRKNILSQALKCLTESNFKLVLQLQMDIKYLKNEEYKEKKRIRSLLIKEKMVSIDQAFSIIHQSSILKAAIYCQENEFKAMGCILDEYSKFIEGTIVQNASLLSQCEIADDGTDKGIWKTRGMFKLDSSRIIKQLENNNTVLYIEPKEEDN